MGDTRETAFERLEAAIGLLREWTDNDDITAPIERICEAVEAFDAWKTALKAEPPDPDRERVPAVGAGAPRSQVNRPGSSAPKPATTPPFHAVWPMYDDGPER